ncbi:iron-siderophore ABC transporter substrate-binding protein [Prauserella muralis]|uniref:Iron ABC transporter substrate-binding protein n=1 Tax=Prauserella muralis TaxID=588067 RepID=A0A2V4B9P1_9PSEU|nr:iron-siderophore ABC transporter substrate-binding protein [Prauserella muralis]PXY31980.1 iron ABC transporter substrate-binding protein [Prauserella muralis]TWE13589.1 iron complex transport system substrate-binding protein [Prauserella muralis]
MSANTGKPAKARLRLPAALLALVLGVVLAACGGSGEEPSGGDTSPAAQSGAFPVTIEHKYGTTEITEQPKKVVTLGLSDQDAVLALGVKPVGVVDWFKERPYGKWPWTKQRWGGTQPAIVGERDEYNMEKVAELQPDVIIAQYSGMTKEQYDKLSQIAPVVAQPKGYPDYAAPWKDMARPIGKALGREDTMNDLIEQTDQKFAKVREQHPEFAEETLTVADSFEPGIYSAFTSSDPKAIFFREMGFKLDPKIDELAQEGANVAELSSEQLDVLDTDRLVWVTSSEEANDRIKAEPLYQRLKVHQQGRDLFVPYENPDIGAAFSFNTVLSIPYAIDQMVPRLTGQSGK